MLIEATEIYKGFSEPGGYLEVLKGITLSIEPADFVAIVGPSGAGKSTFLHILGLLDKPTKGELTINGIDPFKLYEKDLALYRNKMIGFVFQFHHLLAEFTAEENVALPMMIAGYRKTEALSKAGETLSRLGLDGRAKAYISELSGGELQRVAVARALVMDPPILIADEPTGDLDENNSKLLEEIFVKLNNESSQTIILATHNLNFALRAKRIFQLVGGKLVQLRG